MTVIHWSSDYGFSGLNPKSKAICIKMIERFYAEGLICAGYGNWRKPTVDHLNFTFSRENGGELEQFYMNPGSTASVNTTHAEYELFVAKIVMILAHFHKFRISSDRPDDEVWTKAKNELIADFGFDKLEVTINRL